MTMNQLVKVATSTIGNNEVNAVDARELHGFLESGQQFGNWVKNRINQYDFTEGVDFVSYNNSIKADNTYINTKEYTIAMDMAKELSMVERNAKGKQARHYFIECEKQLKISPITIPSKVDDLKALVEMAGIFGVTGNQGLLSANTAMKKIHGMDCMETLGVTHLISEDQTQYFTPTVLGKPVGISAVMMNRRMEAAGLQVSHRDQKGKIVWDVTDYGKSYCQILDTNKKRSDGTPVVQIKWSKEVLNKI